MQKTENARSAAPQGTAAAKKSFAERRLLVEAMPRLGQLKEEARDYVRSQMPARNESSLEHDERAAPLRAKIEQLSSSGMRRMAEFLAIVDGMEFSNYVRQMRGANPKIKLEWKSVEPTEDTPSISFRFVCEDGRGIQTEDFEPTNYAISAQETQKMRSIINASNEVLRWMDAIVRQRTGKAPEWRDGNAHGYSSATTQAYGYLQLLKQI